MLAASDEIQLLPLPAVLFPGTFLPVQIAQDTHRDLLRACAEGGKPLGVVYAPGDTSNGRQTVPAVTGCVASVALFLADGEDEQSSNVVLYGERRMRVLNVLHHDSCPLGQITLLDDVPGLHAEHRTKQANALFKTYLRLIRERYQLDAIGITLPDDPILASYLLASVLMLPLEVKQRCLESSSAAYRLEEELVYLRAECDKLETLLALSRHTQRHFTFPDPALYLSLVSMN